jgi:hypothetical protein
LVGLVNAPKRCPRDVISSLRAFLKYKYSRTAFLLSSATNMASFRDHRVIIASLFLPNTVALTGTPLEDTELSYFPEQDTVTTPPLLTPPPLPRSPATPLRSIVEDMTVKVA